ncbi:ribonuclease H-like domain-containing protein [Tanacetum coccineum]
MDPNTSLGRIFMGEQHGVSFNDKVESEGHWDASKFQDTANSGETKIAKAFTFYKMDTEEVSDRYITPCFVSGLHAYDGEINLENEKNMISNEFAVKLLLDYEEKNGEKILKIELLTKGIVDFRNEIITIYPDLDPFDDDSDNSDDSGDDCDAILEGVDFGNIPQLDGIDVPLFVCNMGKSARNKKKPCGNYKMTYSDEGPYLTVKKPLTQEEMSHEVIEKDIYERILILQEPRPIIETLKFSDQHKKLLDSILLDKLKLDGKVEIDEEEATEEVIRGYKTIREKNDLGVFVLPIRIEAKFDTHALADTGSNINVIPYGIYEKLRREEVKPVSKKITMLDHSKADPIGILKDVLCQVGVTTILAKFLILDIPVDKDVPIVVGRSFLYTCGEITNTIKGTNSTFDGVCHKKIYVAAVRNKHEESDSDDEEEYCITRDKNGKPIYGPKFTKYLNSDDPMNRDLALQEALNPFRKICKGDGDGKWHAKVRIVDPYETVYDQGMQTLGTNDFEVGSSSPPKRTRQHETVEEAMLPHIYSPIIVDWEVLNNMSCVKEIEEMLEIKVYEMGGDEEIFTSEAWRRAFDIREPVYAELCHEFYASYEFDETVIDEDLMSRKVIKFRLGGRGHTLTILEFSLRLGLYSSDEIQDEGFETYFRGGLRNDDHFNVNQYWSEISSEDGLILFRSSAGTIRKLILRVLQKMIIYGLCQRTTRYNKVQRNELWLMSMFEAKNQNGYANVAWLIARSLDTTTLRELIDSNGRLIAEEPVPGDPRVAIPRPPRHSISDLYDRMGRMELRQGELERMARRQSYHSDRYAGVFEYMTG